MNSTHDEETVSGGADGPGEASPASGPLRVVVVGAGGMGRAWLRTVQACELVEPVGVVDIDPAKAGQALAELEMAGLPVADDLAVLARSVEPQAVIDVTVPEAHHPVTMQSFALGLPVLGEKPLAAGLVEALELAAASEAYDRLFMVSQSRRYNPQLFAYRDLIKDLGTLGILTAEFFKAPRFGGFREEMASPLILDMAIHAFDSARFLTDAEPVSVYCEEFNPSWSWYGGDAAASAIFELDDGSRFVYNGSWCSPGAETSWNASWRASTAGGTAVWDGDHEPGKDGTCEAGDTGSETGRAPATGAAAGEAATPDHVRTAARLVGSGHTGLDGSLREFVAALRSGRPPMGECHDNLMSLAMVYGAIESSRTGRRVRITDLLERARSEALRRTSGHVHDVLAAWTTLGRRS